MGEVYKARDTKLGRDVALKILPAAVAADPDRLARFRREAHVLASLNHPHIAAIYGFEDVGDTHFLVLELVDGEPLDRRIARGRMPIDEALSVAQQITQALEAAHEKGIVHRDLKPSNVALTKDDAVKVLDFGLAKATELASAPSPDFGASPTITSPAMTNVGAILGTAAYMAPERAKGKPADKRSDIWAFGCVLCRTCTRASRVLCGDVYGQPFWSADGPDRLRVSTHLHLTISSALDARFTGARALRRGGRPCRSARRPSGRTALRRGRCSAAC